jgi:hypothetical protein
MKPVVPIRTASILLFIHAAMHTIGGVFGHQQPGPQTIAVAAMKSNQFLLMGHLRSFWDFYRGMGLGITISLTAEAVLLWQLASLAKINPRFARPMLITFAVAYAAFAVNSYTYFFAGPVIAELLVVALLLAAIFAISANAIEHQQLPAARLQQV